MKTTITITGQLSGNFKLRNAIKTFEAKESKLFNDITLEFPTKKAARVALFQAYLQLRAAGETSLGYTPRHSLSYDASYATING